jgi:hypothetical protein
MTVFFKMSGWVIIDIQSKVQTRRRAKIGNTSKSTADVRNPRAAVPFANQCALQVPKGGTEQIVNSSCLNKCSVRYAAESRSSKTSMFGTSTCRVHLTYRGRFCRAGTKPNGCWVRHSQLSISLYRWNSSALYGIRPSINNLIPSLLPTFFVFY